MSMEFAKCNQPLTPTNFNLFCIQGQFFTSEKSYRLRTNFLFALFININISLPLTFCSRRTLNKLQKIGKEEKKHWNGLDYEEQDK